MKELLFSSGLAEIFSDPGTSQKALIEFEYYLTGGWFSPKKVQVERLRVLNTITLNPSGLIVDLEIAVAEILHKDATNISIRLEVVEVRIDADPPMLFI